MKQIDQNRRGERTRGQIKVDSKEKGFLEKGLPFLIRYRDHVLFRNCDAEKIEPCNRQAVGWVVAENSLAVNVCSDMPLELSSEPKKESGLVILKSDIVECRKISFDKPFKQKSIAPNGQEKPYN